MANFFCSPVWTYIIVTLIFMLATCLLVTFPVNMLNISSQFFSSLCLVLILGLICQQVSDKHLWIPWTIVGIASALMVIGLIQMIYHYFVTPLPINTVVVSKINVLPETETKDSTNTSQKIHPTAEIKQELPAEPVGLEESTVKSGEHFSPF